MPAHEVNFDGLVGPTHNYAGLSYGNVASTKHKETISNPRAAALQGLEKIKFLASLGLKQGVLPPQPRPSLATLRAIGFTGSDSQIVEKAFRESPALLASVYSASSMWAANAATVSPSADTADGRVHFTPANLLSQFHRSIEPRTTARILKAIFPDEKHFAHHPPLPCAAHFSDEGAANHTRLCAAYDSPGVEIFAFGRVAFDPSIPGPVRFPARQTREASEAVARSHLLDPVRCVFFRQSPQAIDAGAFHNDVVAVGNCDTLFFHEHAIADRERTLDEIRAKFPALRAIIVPAWAVSLGDAVSSYLFNSQLVTLAGGDTALVAPTECRENPRVAEFLDSATDFTAYYVDVRQSMQNGGGPACLRLRVVLTDVELSRVHPGVMFTDALYERLKTWIEKHYRDRIAPHDLRDPKLIDESAAAMDALSRILALPL